MTEYSTSSSSYINGNQNFDSSSVDIPSSSTSSSVGFHSASSAKANETNLQLINPILASPNANNISLNQFYHNHLTSTDTFGQCLQVQNNSYRTTSSSVPKSAYETAASSWNHFSNSNSNTNLNSISNNQNEHNTNLGSHQNSSNNLFISSNSFHAGD